MLTLRQLVRRALSRLPDATMRAAVPRPLCAPLACRTAAVATAAAPRHPVFGALRASSLFGAGSRALLHARTRPVQHRTAVAPHPPRAQAVAFEETGLAADLLEAVRRRAAPPCLARPLMPRRLRCSGGGAGPEGRDRDPGAGHPRDCQGRSRGDGVAHRLRQDAGLSAPRGVWRPRGRRLTRVTRGGAADARRARRCTASERRRR